MRVYALLVQEAGLKDPREDNVISADGNRDQIDVWALRFVDLRLESANDAHVDIRLDCAGTGAELQAEGLSLGEDHRVGVR